MSGFESTWALTRKRFDDAVAGLTNEQLNWRMHPGSLTLGESALHVAGVEVSFISQLLGTPLDAETEKLKAAATDGVVNERQFPYPAREITVELVQRSLETARNMVAPAITDPTPEVLNAKIVSALGPVIDGTGAFARLAYHPGYHQGQAHLIKTAPGFPQD